MSPTMKCNISAREKKTIRWEKTAMRRNDRRWNPWEDHSLEDEAHSPAPWKPCCTGYHRIRNSVIWVWPEERFSTSWEPISLSGSNSRFVIPWSKPMRESNSDRSQMFCDSAGNVIHIDDSFSCW
jgi:hypothetical protein